MGSYLSLPGGLQGLATKMVLMKWWAISCTERFTEIIPESCVYKVPLLLNYYFLIHIYIYIFCEYNRKQI